MTAGVLTGRLLKSDVGADIELPGEPEPATSE
jgi:hypothetical protein